MIKVYVDSKTRIVFLTLTWHGKRIYVSTGFKSETKVNGTDVGQTEIQRHRFRTIYNESEDFLYLHPRATPEQVKRRLKEIINGYNEDGSDLASCIKRVAATKSERTRPLYELTAKRVAAYDSDVKPDDVTPAWLDAFRKDQADKGRMVNGIAIDLRNIRATFNWLIDQGETEAYPFRRYRIKHEETRKRNLSDEQLRTLKQHLGNRYIDFFFLQMYLRGINFNDLYSATPDQLHDGRFNYKRNKTGRQFSVKVEPEAMAIINKYRSSERLVDFRRSRGDLALNFFDKILKDFVPDISSNSSRHTVASVAAKIGIPIDVVGQLLGHANAAHSTTMIYVNYDERRSDEAMRKVIDYINKV